MKINRKFSLNLEKISYYYIHNFKKEQNDRRNKVGVNPWGIYIAIEIIVICIIAGCILGFMNAI